MEQISLKARTSPLLTMTSRQSFASCRYFSSMSHSRSRILLSDIFLLSPKRSDLRFSIDRLIFVQLSEDFMFGDLID